MTPTQTDRRGFLRAGAATSTLLAAMPALADETTPPHVATNEYPWGTFYRRQGKEFRADLAASIAEVAAAGFQGFEPLASSPRFLEQLVPLLKDNGLAMRSIYVNSVLHDSDRVATEIDTILAIADKAKALADTAVVVTNPSPIRWGGPEAKSDAQLRTQAAALDRLGSKLRSSGMTLAYHNHDAELRHAAREFHHMLAGTDPEHVSFCLDAHWVFRGAGDSSVALFDVVTLYGSRVRELHLRQSREGIWTEAFGPGDIDYPALAHKLGELGVRPLLVLEQAVEAGSQETMSAVEAHAKGRAVAADMFSRIAG